MKRIELQTFRIISISTTAIEYINSRKKCTITKPMLIVALTKQLTITRLFICAKISNLTGGENVILMPKKFNFQLKFQLLRFYLSRLMRISLLCLLFLSPLCRRFSFFLILIFVRDSVAKREIECQI